jgi:uncharacterized protein
MSSGSVALDMDRLPWLPDEEGPRRTGGRRRGLLVSALAATALLAGVSYWLGIRDSVAPGNLSGGPQTSFSANRLDLAPTRERPAEAMVPLPPPPEAQPTDSQVATSAEPASPTAKIDPPAQPKAKLASAPAGAEPQADCTDGQACGDAYLARLERQVDSLYRHSWTAVDAPTRGLLQRTHERFVARLDACRSEACRSRTHVARSVEIRDISTGQWKPQASASEIPENLAGLDRHLASLYSQSWGRADAAQRAKLVRTQQHFVDRRDACRSDSCKSAVFLDRMREVSDIMTAAREQASVEAKPR